MYKPENRVSELINTKYLGIIMCCDQIQKKCKLNNDNRTK